LDAQGFNFNIPASATINGDVISITKDSLPQNGIIDQYVQSIKGGVISGNNYEQFGKPVALAPMRTDPPMVYGDYPLLLPM
jgi:hypothetical protein